MRKGNSKVVRETEDGNEVNDQGLREKEMQIVRQERKKRIINHMLCTTFHQVNEKGFENIVEKSCWRRLMLSAPERFEFKDKDITVPFHLVRDEYDKFPTYERNLYCMLDYDMLILAVCVTFLIDWKTDNPMVALCVSYAIERFFRFLRSWLGEGNLAKKTFTDECFLV